MCFVWIDIVLKNSEHSGLCCVHDSEIVSFQSTGFCKLTRTKSRWKPFSWSVLIFTPTKWLNVLIALYGASFFFMLFAFTLLFLVVLLICSLWCKKCFCTERTKRILLSILYAVYFTVLFILYYIIIFPLSFLRVFFVCAPRETEHELWLSSKCGITLSWPQSSLATLLFSGCEELPK